MMAKCHLGLDCWNNWQNMDTDCGRDQRRVSDTSDRAGKRPCLRKHVPSHLQIVWHKDPGKTSDNTLLEIHQGNKIG